MTKLPVTAVSVTPFTPPFELMLSKVAVTAPLPRLTPAPPLFVTEILFMINVPTLAPLIAVPLLVLMFNPRMVLPEPVQHWRLWVESQRRMERLGEIVKLTPWPINS